MGMNGGERHLPASGGMGKARPCTEAEREELSDASRYTLMYEIGRGTFGKVFLARDEKTQEHIAIKALKRGTTIDKTVLRELEANASICHPHIVRFRAAFLCRHYLAIVFDYCPDGDLLEYVSKRGPVAEALARSFFQQLIIAIAYCHLKGNAHRDIKLENVLLHSQYLIKLCDWGGSKNAKHSLPKSMVGTPNYIAPEILESSTKSHKPYNGQLADAYSCGVLLYTMLFARYPFYRPEDRKNPNANAEAWKRMTAVDYTIPERPQISEGCRDMLQRLIVRDPHERMSISELMTHPWFLQGLPEGWEQLNLACLQRDIVAGPVKEREKQEYIKCIWEQARFNPDAEANAEYYDSNVRLADILR